MQKPLIIAHRGESFDAPENTLAAINLAWQRNADAVEIDIQLTKDNKIVVFHDFNTKRICGVNKTIKKQTFKELRLLDVGSFKNSKFKGEKIPDLKEVLKTIPIGKKLIIEIKTDEKIIPVLQKELGSFSDKTKQIEFIGFNLKVVSRLKKLYHRNKCLWLLDLDYTEETAKYALNIQQIKHIVKENNLDGVDCWAGKFITKQFVEELKQADLKIYLWTVDNLQQAEHFSKLGIDGITTNQAFGMKSNIKFK